MKSTISTSESETRQILSLLRRWDVIIESISSICVYYRTHASWARNRCGSAVSNLPTLTWRKRDVVCGKERGLTKRLEIVATRLQPWTKAVETLPEKDLFR